MPEFVIGIRCFLRGFTLIFKPGIRAWAVVPVILSATIYVVLFWWASTHASDVIAWAEAGLPSWLSWLGSVMWVLFWVLAVVLITFTFVLVADVVSSPFNGPLAEATERTLTGENPPTLSLARMVVRLPRILIQEMKKLLYAMVFSIPFLLLFLVPAVNAVAPVLWFFWSAWVLALAYTDYTLDNNGFLFRDMRRLLYRHRLATWGFGAAASIAFTIPVLNILAVPSAVCGGTVLWIEVLKPDQGELRPGAQS